MKPDEEMECKKQQFGEAWPSMETPCKLCGKPYGEHYGLECPGEGEDTL